MLFVRRRVLFARCVLLVVGGCRCLMFVVCCSLLFGCRSVFVMCSNGLSLFVVVCIDVSCSSLACVVRRCLLSLVAFCS